MKKKLKIRPILFSGVRTLRLTQFNYVDEIIDGLRGNVFMAGGAYGVDAYAMEQALKCFPTARFIIVLPFEMPTNDVHLASMEKAGAEILEMPRPKNRSVHPAVLRNEWMVKEMMKISPDNAKLVAFPGGPDEVIRSGTWTTIRRARDAGMKVEIYPLTNAPGMVMSGSIEK